MAEGSLFFVGRREGDGSDPLCCDGTRLFTDPDGQLFPVAYFGFRFPFAARHHGRSIATRGLANLHVVR